MDLLDLDNELVESSRDDRVLDGQQAEVVAIFCDLRGFTAFSLRAEPEEIMGVLGEYYATLGDVITRHKATLTSFAGDGLMVLVNAPVPCADPALRAARLAIDMQRAVQGLIIGWQQRGYIIGFGIGFAMGPATVGSIGYGGHFNYTAIGNVVNLASRLCSAAENQQILVDSSIAAAVGSQLELSLVGGRFLKGYGDRIDVFLLRTTYTKSG